MRKPTKAQIGEWLLHARLEARDRAPEDKKEEFAQAGVAHTIGVRERAVRMWEKGRNAPPADKFLALVLLYEADVLELLAQKYTGKRTTAASGGGGDSGEPERKRRVV